MKFFSTRGDDSCTFDEVILKGLANDGGLFLPYESPTWVNAWSKQRLLDSANLSYPELSAEILFPFVGTSISKGLLLTFAQNAYKGFRHPMVAPIRKVENNLYLLDLFHGPTYAFKDFALQLVGHLFSHFLSKKNKHALAIGATSGDTGSAAIFALMGKPNISVAILHPYNRISEKQRRQMTCVNEENIFNFAVKGNFDDCQNMVKSIFGDLHFRETLDRKNCELLSVNSINFGRLGAQIIYYFWAFFQLLSQTKNKEELIDNGVVFAVPCGNFGNVYAGLLAQKMGLPVKKFIVATNKNDILHRFFNDNAYKKEPLVKTQSPSMDILVSSNFERYLFDLHLAYGLTMEQTQRKIRKLMQSFQKDGEIKLDEAIWKKTQPLFCSKKYDDTQTLQTIEQFYKKHQILLDPHSAIGVQASLDFLATSKYDSDSMSSPVISLLTAHPVKFDQAYKELSFPITEKLDQLDGLLTKQEKVQAISVDIMELKRYLQKIPLQN